MSQSARTVEAYDVVVVGAGPVGLLLAGRLSQLGLRVVVLEKGEAPVLHSRSVGIHPPSLELLRELAVVDDFLREGVKVENGKAFGDKGCLGTLSFSHCSGPYRLVLTLPQFKAERILETQLEQAAPGTVRRGAVFHAIRNGTGGLLVQAQDSGGQLLEFRAEFLVGCDGKDSQVRECLGIGFVGGAYPDTFVMGDLEARHEPLNEAWIFLTRHGLVESFPLPEGLRRWVVKTDSFEKGIDLSKFCRLIRERTGNDLNGRRNVMLSAFGVQRYHAQRMYRDRVVIAGDAAHVISPIGGQGMNLGWLNAWALAEAIHRILRLDGPEAKILRAWERRCAARARRCGQRAERNMWIGRKTSWWWPRNAAIWFLLHSPAERLLARVFTMRWI